MSLMGAYKNMSLEYWGGEFMCTLFHLLFLINTFLYICQLFFNCYKPQEENMWILYSDVDYIHFKLNVLLALTSVSSAAVFYHVVLRPRA